MSTNKSQIGTWMSRLAQSAYGAVRAAGDDYRRSISNDQTVIELDTAFENDANFDTGSDVASDIWAITNDSGLTVPFDFCFQDIGYWLHLGLGGYSVTGPDSGGRYTHVFTPQNVNSSRQLPARTFGKKYGGIKIIIMPDGVCTNLTLNGAKTGRIKCSGTVKGSGNYMEDPASYNQPALETDRIYGYNQQARLAFNDDSIGTAQIISLTVGVTAVTAGSFNVVVAGAAINGSPVTVPVTTAGSENASAVAVLIRAALASSPQVRNALAIGGATTTVTGTALVKAANDTGLTFTISANSVGVTGASSTVSTPGVVGDYQNYSCAIETWSFVIDNPESDPGYRACSQFLVADTPSSGAVRAEYLVGVRKYTMTFESRLETGDKMRGYLKNGTNLKLYLPIIGTNVDKHRMDITDTKVRVIESKESIVGEFIGVKGTVQCLSSSGSIPLTITLINDVVSYVS